MYPKGIFGVVHCLKCGFTLPASRWDELLHRVYNGLKAGYKTPISYWKGAIRTAVGLVVGVVLLAKADPDYYAESKFEPKDTGISLAEVQACRDAAGKSIGDYFVLQEKSASTADSSQ